MGLTNKLDKLIRSLQQDYQTLNTIEVSRRAILHNFDYLKSLHRGFQIIPVLKANAYGHGLEEVTTILKERAFPYIAVDGYFEALQIRQLSPQPVLIMGAIHPNNYPKIKFNDFTFVVGDQKQLEALGALKKRIKIHLDINTGMNRQGFQSTELPRCLELLKRYKKLEVEGVMSHLADADNPIGEGYTMRQTQLFDEAVGVIKEAGFNPAYIHLANSPGTPKAESEFANTIRPGIALYGLNPLDKRDIHFKRLAKLQPALSLKSTIVKEIPLRRGDKVSYNGIFSAPQPMRVGIVPIGYYEGVPRVLSNRGWIQYKGQFLPIVGRICMNHTIINLQETHAKLWEPVTVISSKPADRNSVAQICAQNKLFAYALVVGLSKDIRRQLVS